MNVKRSDRDDIRDDRICVPMSKREKEAVQRTADDMGVTVSALARMVLKDFMKKSRQ